jgi:PEP-CTERM motif-containing protein
MIVARIARTLPPLSICLWVMMAKPALAAPIFGVTFAHGIYSIDPLTGNATQLLAGCTPGCGGTLGASGSPDAGSVFDNTINLHETNVTTFQDTILGGLLHGLDLAFDRGTNTLYDTSGSAPFAVQCPSPPGLCTETQVGPAFPTSHMQALGFVPGAGLYGVSDNFLYLINDSTGATTPVGATGLLDLTKAITDLAYDAGTGRLIASAGCSKFDPFTLFSGPCDESHQGSIYLIDRSTGHATLLNGNAPMIVGLAEVVPEPSSASLFALGLGAFLVWSSRRARTTPAIGSRLRPERRGAGGCHRDSQR